MNQEELSEILKNLGLNQKQAAVYLACLELGSGTIQEIAKKSQVKRTSIYNFLEDMKARGLLTVIEQDNKVLLVAEDPHILLNRAQDQVKQLEKMMPEFRGIFNRPGTKPRVRFYQGIDGLKKIYEDTLLTGETIYEISDFEKMFTAMEPNWMWDYPLRRAQKGIKAFSIAKDGNKAREVRSQDKKQRRETRLVKNVQFETEINLYGDKVALLSFRRPYAGIVIEDRAIAQTLKSIWNILWQTAK